MSTSRHVHCLGWLNLLTVCPIAIRGRIGKLRNLLIHQIICVLVSGQCRLHANHPPPVRIREVTRITQMDVALQLQSQWVRESDSLFLQLHPVLAIAHMTVQLGQLTALLLAQNRVQLLSDRSVLVESDRFSVGEWSMLTDTLFARHFSVIAATIHYLADFGLLQLLYRRSIRFVQITTRITIISCSCSCSCRWSCSCRSCSLNRRM